MEKVIITREDLNICMDNYNRDFKMLQKVLKCFIFINKITFGLIESRLLFQYDKLLAAWENDMQQPGYFDKKGIDFSDTNKLVNELTKVINQN